MNRKDDELDFDRYRGSADRRLLIPVIIVAILLVIVIAAFIFLNHKSNSGKEPDGTGGISVTESDEDTQTLETMAGTAESDKNMDDPQDPQNIAGSMSSETGASVDIKALLSASDVEETEGITFGIDVAKYQGTIDWKQVAESGVEFAMVRVGYRTQKTGEICEDTNAKYNMQEAQANGIKVGAYFFSSAVTEQEAVEEADWVAEYISQYQITYPVAYNCEGFDDQDSRQNSLTQAQRTEYAMAFLNKIYEHGYTPMFYASKNELTGDAKWDTSKIEPVYKIWVSQYPAVPYPNTSASDYTGVHVMWQYTNQGTIPGISRPVDVNIAYFGYEGTADAKSDTEPEAVTADAEALMKFSEVNETVTAKEKTNLRDIPSQGTDSTVVATLSNGETATRTGVSDSGWSRLEYNGAVYYAVSDYLTSDFNYKPSDKEGSGSGDGLKTKFTEVNDVVTAKIEVNLRALPSVTNPDAVVVAVLHNGETATRTGVNNEYGWSRVEYNGQTLYCISSYLTGAQ